MLKRAICPKSSAAIMYFPEGLTYIDNILL
jgi:hypothetical protein